MNWRQPKKKRQAYLTPKERKRQKMLEQLKENAIDLTKTELGKTDIETKQTSMTGVNEQQAQTSRQEIQKLRQNNIYRPLRG
jgi:hypothetical protein